MKEQIEKQAIMEMADEIRRIRESYFGQADYLFAKKLFEDGYRKQKEGEWITSDIPQEKYVCSVCGGACWYYDYQADVARSKYCPNCGAKMKGE